MCLTTSKPEGVDNMSIEGNKYPIEDTIFPQHILVSVFDKTRLDVLVDGILDINPETMFYSTGGTGRKLIEILGDNAIKNYMSVEDFTGAPEMEGGLVKTLHPKIHAGLLGERGNPNHKEYIFKVMNDLTGSPGVYFDVMVGSLYPFEKTIAKEGATPEDARSNIDIGGPTMVMAAAKNWHSVAVVTSPDQYAEFNEALKTFKGTPAYYRFSLAQKAMGVISNYRTAIAEYFANLDFTKDVEPTIVYTEDSK